MQQLSGQWRVCLTPPVLVVYIYSQEYQPSSTVVIGYTIYCTSVTGIWVYVLALSCHTLYCSWRCSKGTTKHDGAKRRGRLPILFLLLMVICIIIVLIDASRLHKLEFPSLSLDEPPLTWYNGKVYLAAHSQRGIAKTESFITHRLPWYKRPKYQQS